MYVTVKNSSANDARRASIKLLREAGYKGFDDFWGLPHEFVDDVNIRRNGWSAVSALAIDNAKGVDKNFFVKRQENQQRYSLRHPLGVLTYQFEIEAIAKMTAMGLPCVRVVDQGFRRADGKRQGYVVTEAIDGESLKDFASTGPDWGSVNPQLEVIAQELFRLHETSWQHGALYPVHIFVNWKQAQVTFIDLERARRSRTPMSAAEADFIQFIKRAKDIPDSVLQTLLTPYAQVYPKLIKRLEARFPYRQLKP